MLLITAFCLSRKAFEQNVPISSLAALLENEDYYVWVDIEGCESSDINVLRNIFHFDELSIEDCLHGQQLPKLETFETYHFFILQGVDSYTQDIRCHNVELDGYLGDRYLVTVHMKDQYPPSLNLFVILNAIAAV
jgi:Mg2+ and Co2+ transporter CorA